jgi:hypothetical protein
MLLTIGGLVVAVVLALKILVMLVEPRLTFFPVADYPLTPPDLGLPFEEVRLKTADGVEIQSWFVPGLPLPDGGGRRPLTLLFFHGNAENLGVCVPLASLTRAYGYSLMLVDYRGYGRSDGQPSEKGIYLDGRAALDHLRGRREVDPKRIVVWGRSIGAAVAVRLAADHGPVAGVVLESPFTSARDLLREAGYWPLYALSFFGSYRFDLAEAIGRVKAPVLVVHGSEDEVVPFSLGRRLYEMAPGRKRFRAIEGGGHNDLFARHREALWGAVRRFLATVD